jgi:signal transduction histidine kinase/ligand-binding sensor domain-containing protein
VQRRWAVTIGGLLFTAASPALALDPERAPSQYVLTKWDAGSLPSGGIHALRQTRDHYLWLGTGAGLARFDGTRFAAFTARHAPGYADGGVTQLAEGPGGALYVGTTSGVVMQYREGAFAAVPVPPGTGAVRVLLAARDGSLWVSVHGRAMSRVLNGRSVSLFGDLGPEVSPSMAEDAAGHVWIGTWRSGLIEFDGKRYTRHPVLRDTVQALLIDAGGTFWIGTPHGLYRLEKDGTLAHFTTADGLSHDSVSALALDRDGNLWIGTAGGGLDRLRGGRFSRLTTHEGLSDDDVRCLLEDHEGNLWVGTADGLNCLSNGRFVTYGTHEGLPDPGVASVAESADGSVWLGTSSAAVVRLRDGSMTTYKLPAGIGREAVLAMHVDRRRALWIALENSRLFRIDGAGVVEHTPAVLKGEWKIPLILEDDEGPLFYVTRLGLARLQDHHLVPIHPNAPTFSYAHCAYRDAQGVLWLGTARGLVRIEGDKYHVFRQQDGLPHERVRSICPDGDGALWVATIGGLAYVKNGTIQKATAEDGLPENYLRLVLDDGLGHLWVAATGHVFRIEKRELHDLFAGRLRQLSPLSFDTSDGLRTTEAILSNSPGFRARDGRLWFATSRGVSVVDPSRIRTDEPAPSPRIERIIVDRLAGARTEYPPGRGEVTIEYAAFGFRAPGKVRFRYRMDGWDQDWVAADTQRSAYYSNLPAGQYRFSVMASNRDGEWNGVPAVLAFTLKPPFHRTALFYVLCAAGLALAALVVHRLRVRQMRTRFTVIIGERTRIARELHDTLAQGMAGVGLQIDTALDRLPPEPALAKVRQHMQLARRMVLSSLAEVRRSIWVLRAQTSRDKEGFSQALAESLEQLTTDSRAQAQLNVSGLPRVLSSEVERNLLRIAHESVMNAVRHAEAQTITVDLRFEPEAVHLRIHDDGKGFVPENVPGDGAHFGLAGIAERVSALGGAWRIDSRPGMGTEVGCRLPYECRIETVEVDATTGISL